MGQVSCPAKIHCTDAPALRNETFQGFGGVLPLQASSSFVPVRNHNHLGFIFRVVRETLLGRYVEFCDALI